MPAAVVAAIVFLPLGTAADGARPRHVEEFSMNSATAPGAGGVDQPATASLETGPVSLLEPPPVAPTGGTRRRRGVALVAGLCIAALAAAGVLAVVNRTSGGGPATIAAGDTGPASTAALPPLPVPTAVPSTPLPPTALTATAPSRPRPAAGRQAGTAGAAPSAADRSVARKPAATGVRGTGRIVDGRTYSGRATSYGATGAGNCMFDPSADLMVTAMNQQDYGNAEACGAWLAVTGPSGATITVKVVDRCPECPPGALDLSQQAFARLAPLSAGQISVTWRLLSPALSGPVAYVYKDGSSRYWCGIQVRNHRNPIRSLAVQVGGAWQVLPRRDYNYFESATGAGCGAAIRITDIYGHQLTDVGIAIRPGAVQRGHAQFGPPT